MSIFSLEKQGAPKEEGIQKLSDNAAVQEVLQEYGGKDLEVLLGLEDVQVEKAVGYAAEMHQGQMRKGAEIPYIVHPLGVAAALSKADCSSETVVAGVLHDVLEDTPATLEAVRRDFGEAVADIVGECSEDKDLSWEERKQHTMDEMGNVSLEACLVTIADKDHNLSATLEDIAAVGADAVWNKFKRGRDAQEWYFRGLVAAMKGRVSEMTDAQEGLYVAFAQKVEEVFQ